MNRQQIAEFIDAIAKGDDEKITESGRILALNKVKEKLGYVTEENLNEVGEVKITNNDVFVSGKKVGTVNIDSDDAVVEFTDNEGEAHAFDNTEELHRYLNGLNESDNRQKRLKDAIKNLPDNRGERMNKAADRIVVKSSDGDGEQGDYKKHDTRKNQHKDSRMENPKKHDHGHDDSSGLKETSGSKSSGSHPEDKKHVLSKHKDSRMENPKRHDHGHDDKSGLTPSANRASSGGNPPDKTHDLKNSKHKDPRMENPKKHDHGHDDKSAKIPG